MKLLDVLQSETVCLDLVSRDKIGVLGELADRVANVAGVDRDRLIRVLLERERLGSTGIGEGIGIPHGKLPDLDRLVIVFGKSLRGVNFDALDGKPVQLFFLIVTPEESTGLHLKVLARISRLLRDPGFRNRLKTTGSIEALFELIGAHDTDF